MALEYDSYRAVHDGGVDFTNVNKHVLAVKCETVRAKIFRISNYYFDQQKLYSKEEVEFDQDLVGKIERFVRNADDDKFDKLLNYDFYTKLLELIYSKYEDLPENGK